MLVGYTTCSLDRLPDGLQDLDRAEWLYMRPDHPVPEGTFGCRLAQIAYGLASGYKGVRGSTAEADSARLQQTAKRLSNSCLQAFQVEGLQSAIMPLA